MVRLMLLTGNLIRDGVNWGLGRQARSPRVQPVPVGANGRGPRQEQAEALRVMTLNLAHARKHSARHTVRRPHRESHMLEDVARIIQEHRPDLVALQEADARSRLRGNINHVEKLAHDGGMAHWVQGDHVRAAHLAYGTALLSNLAVSDAISCTFRPTPPTFTKGFVRATIGWPGRADRPVDVISVHLDFLRNSRRSAQIDEMLHTLGQHRRPMVVMGDFNCDWRSGRHTLQRLAEALDLHAWSPDGDGHRSFPILNRRLDWILVSRDLRFKDYQTLPVRVSDHHPVLAEIEPA
jgi:endonuclease/exonuclease/phosphatase family metal-dependent hydrolase